MRLHSGACGVIEAGRDLYSNTDATIQDGSSNWTVAAGSSLTLAYTFPAPGLYAITIASPSAGISKTYTIVVKDPAQVDALLKGVYTGMLDKLKTGDITGALYAVTGGVHAKYQAVFTTLQANLPVIVNQLGTLSQGSIGTEFSEYALVSNTPTGTQAYLVYFLRGEDGVWRIDGM